MKRTIEDVLPIGTPWGGPESVRFLSCFVSTLMKIDNAQGTEQELRARHEWLYHLYLTVTGVSVSTVWSAGLALRPHDQIMDDFLPDTIERSMVYAGCRYGIVETDAIAADLGTAANRVRASIDAGVPVPLLSSARQWSLITGYDNDGRTIIGWDGSQGYWGAPAIAPDAYLAPGLFATALRPEFVSRLVFVEGRTTPQAEAPDVVRYVAGVMEEQRRHGYGREFRALLADDAWCASADGPALRNLWSYIDAWVGWYAESRAFACMALSERFPGLPDTDANPESAVCIEGAARCFGHTHDLSWESWRALRVEHRCGQPEEEPCRMCGGCLRPANEEDYGAFRRPERRRKLEGLIGTIEENDRRARDELKRCAEAL